MNISTEGALGRHTALKIELGGAPAPNVEPERVVVPRLNQREHASQSPYLHYVRLTRFAAQRVYGPPRLVSDDDLSAVDKLDTTTTVAIVRGDRVIATPIAAWTDGIYTVTALKLQNGSTESVLLDPRQLRGRWLAATFQHNVLGEQGAANDVSALYVVSSQAFADALGAVR